MVGFVFIINHVFVSNCICEQAKYSENNCLLTFIMTCTSKTLYVPFNQYKRALSQTKLDLGSVITDTSDGLCS